MTYCKSGGSMTRLLLTGLLVGKKNRGRGAGADLKSCGVASCGC